MIFQRVGALPYCHTEVCDYLDLILHGRWTGRAGRIPWPPRFPSDFSVCGFVRHVVHFHNPSNPQSDQQQPITEVVNKVDLTSVKFRALRNTDSQRLVVAHRVSICTPLDGMFIPPWNTKIKYLESESVASHLFHACSCYQTIDLGHLATITWYSWNQYLSRLFQH